MKVPDNVVRRHDVVVPSPSVPLAVAPTRCPGCGLDLTTGQGYVCMAANCPITARVTC